MIHAVFLRETPVAVMEWTPMQKPGLCIQVCESHK
jgi:hypothetical protein